MNKLKKSLGVVGIAAVLILFQNCSRGKFKTLAADTSKTAVVSTGSVQSTPALVQTSNTINTDRTIVLNTQPTVITQPAVVITQPTRTCNRVYECDPNAGIYSQVSEFTHFKVLQEDSSSRPPPFDYSSRPSWCLSAAQTQTKCYTENCACRVSWEACMTWFNGGDTTGNSGYSFKKEIVGYEYTAKIVGCL